MSFGWQSYKTIIFLTLFVLGFHWLQNGIHKNLFELGSMNKELFVFKILNLKLTFIVRDRGGANTHLPFTKMSFINEFTNHLFRLYSFIWNDAADEFHSNYSCNIISD